jgi:hypothetical protein
MVKPLLVKTFDFSIYPSLTQEAITEIYPSLTQEAITVRKKINRLFPLA